MPRSALRVSRRLEAIPDDRNLAAGRVATLGMTPPARPDRLLWRSEAGRLIALGAVAGWLLHPFVCTRLLGAGDAIWYANMVADFVTQLRAGVFPIFVGQTEFAFNGSIAPLRAAPFYQHFAAALDLLTGRQLTFITLQNLCVLVSGTLGLFTAYLTLCDLAPKRRGCAAALATLYLSCPGVLGTIYTQDLYLTWMTLPLLPVAAYGIARSFRNDDWPTQCWLVVPLAALWWIHAPIALWFTLIGALSQLTRLIMLHRNGSAWKRACGGGLLFVVLAQFPFVSLFELRIPGAHSTLLAPLDHADRILAILRTVYPSDLLPVSPQAGALADLQLGYGLWLVWFASFGAALLQRNASIGILVGAAFVLLSLLFPIPGVTAFLWQHVPAEFKRITSYWPMQRFYPILAALIVTGGQLAIAALGSSRSMARLLPGAALGLACAWSLWESRQFIAAGIERTAPAVVSHRLQRPENLLITSYAYAMFPTPSPYFSNGVMDPRAEIRLLDRTTFSPEPVRGQRTVTAGGFTGGLDDNPGILRLSPTLRIQSGLRYRLIFTSPRADAIGILQMMGQTLFREYALPSSGKSKAFGFAAGNDPSVSLWTTNPSGEDVTLRFIPMAPGMKPLDFAKFSTFRLETVEPKLEPVTVTSLVPLRAHLDVPGPCWLETPRMAMIGYRAWVDGKPRATQVSPNGLVMIPVNREDRTFELRFVGALALRVSYWLGLGGWLALGLAPVVRLVLPPHPGKLAGS